MTPTPAIPASPTAEASVPPPPVWRASGDNGDILGIGWLHGSLHLAVFRRQKMLGSWSAPDPVGTVADLGAALDKALKELKFAGTEVFLLLENNQLVHQVETTPLLSDSAARAYLHGRVQRYEKEHAPVLWVSQPAARLKKERSFILHMLPKSFYEEVNGLLLERRLELTRILPLIVPMQREFNRFPIAKRRPVLMAVEAGDATMVLVAKVGDDLLFVRTILASWSADSSRIGVEINRSLFYADQQFGDVVERVWLLGQNNSATAEVNAKCGAGRQITVLPTSQLEWLQSAAKLSVRQPVNLVAAHLWHQRLQRSFRHILLAICWVSLALLLVEASTSLRAWNEEHRQIAALRTHAPAMQAERERLLAGNLSVRRERELVRQVDEERLPPVPGKFAAYLAGILPAEVRLTDLTVQWESDARGWSFRIEGIVEADEATARETLAALQRELAQSPLRARSDESARMVVSTRHTPGTAPVAHRFNLAGVMLED